ncbi:MAG: chemotaxis protein CheW [Nitrosomonadales bacterium]|nr:chemotaxis protein CheW [Nitrosomonadales bacterium]
MCATAEIEINNQSTDADTKEYLAFVLGEESYILDILNVQEIRGYDDVTKIANVPDFIKGVVNLRGTIVPIIDLRLMLRLSAITYNDLTVVIILNMNGRVFGIVVDGVSDVVNFDPGLIRPIPEIVTSIDTKYITGLATIGEKMFILVDIDRLINSWGGGFFDPVAHKEFSAA